MRDLTRRLSVVLVAVLALVFPTAAGAQAPGQPPLKATLLLKNPPPNVTYNATSPATPVTILIQIENASAAPILTTERFSTSEFWRKLFFTDPAGGTAVHIEEEAVHGDNRRLHCLSRNKQLLRPTATPVVPVEVLAGPPKPFVLEYELTDARQRFDLSRAGRYIVEARIPLLAFSASDPASVITDCDQYRGRTVVNVGTTAGTGRASYVVLSNRLEFVIENPVQAPPVTTVQRTPQPNDAGWNHEDVTFTFAGSATAERIFVRSDGSQASEHLFVRLAPGTSVTGTLVIDIEGSTTVTARAEDAFGTQETPQATLVRIDRTSPVITLTPPGGNFAPNAPITVQFAAQDPAPPRGAPSGVASVTATLKRPDGTTAPIATGTALTLHPGTTEVRVNALDVAGNIANPAVARYVVPGYTFIGFASPVDNDAACAPAARPCRTFKFGSTIPMKFRLTLNGAPVTTAVARIAAVQVSGSAPAQEPLDLGTGANDTGNIFRFDGQQYQFNLDSRVLSRGTWRIEAHLDDGSTQSVLIGLR